MQEAIQLASAQPMADDWAGFAELKDAGFYQHWLARQSGFIPGAYAGLLALYAAQTQQFNPAAVWPEHARDLNPLLDLVDKVIADGTGSIAVLGQRKLDGRLAYGIAYPLLIGEQLRAVVALAVALDDEADLQQAMRQLQWGVSWLELSLLQRERDSERQRQQALADSVDLLSKVLAESSYAAAALRLVGELALALDCELVSLGEIKQQAAVVSHLSNSAEFGKKMNLVRLVEQAMDEAAEQRTKITFPLSAHTQYPQVTRVHGQLAELQGRACLLTVPLYIADDCVAAVCLQRPAEQPFSEDEADYCESVLALAFSALQEKKHNDAPLWRKIKDAAAIQLKRLFGSRYYGRKLALLLAVLMAGLLCLVDGEYRLSADAVLDTAIQRVVVAPYDGYIQGADVRVGDTVQRNDSLVRLDDRDMQLERLRWKSQASRLSSQYQEATASHNRARIKILDAQLQQAKAQMRLVDSRLARAQLTAPFDGKIVHGDLSRRLGGQVSKGEVLFEVAPLDRYRINLNIAESRIADVKPGQSGRLYLSALPQRAFAFTVDKIIPLTTSRDGATYFRVEAHLEQALPAMQPGMEGVGKITVDRRKLIAIWTRELLEWLRLQWWAWWG